MRALIATTIAAVLLATGAAAAAAPGAPADAGVGAASVAVAAPAGLATAPITFSDVKPGDPYYDAITWMVGQGITTGYPDGTFRPAGIVTREAVAAFLYRSLVSPTIPACTGDTRVFTDVTVSHPFCSAIEWLSTQGISTGWPDHTFRPGEPVSREATAAFLYRAWVSTTIPACTGDTRTFTDVTTSHPFCGAVEALAASAIVTGWPDHTYRPGLSVERQAMAAFLHRHLPA